MSVKFANGTPKGHVFDADNPETLPSFIARRSMEERRAFAEAETERYRIVAACERCGRELIEGEQIPHRMSHEDPKVASAAMTAIQRGPDVARAAARLILEVLGEEAK